jgi:hypothetical protein
MSDPKSGDRDLQKIAEVIAWWRNASNFTLD